MAAAVLIPKVARPYVVRVTTNNRLHIRYELDLRTVDDGRCGIDENWVEVSDNELENADRAQLCLFCFPEA